MNEVLCSIVTSICATKSKASTAEGRQGEGDWREQLLCDLPSPTPAGATQLILPNNGVERRPAFVEGMKRYNTHTDLRGEKIKNHQEQGGSKSTEFITTLMPDVTRVPT